MILAHCGVCGAVHYGNAAEGTKWNLGRGGGEDGVGDAGGFNGGADLVHADDGRAVEDGRS